MTLTFLRCWLVGTSPPNDANGPLILLRSSTGEGYGIVWGAPPCTGKIMSDSAGDRTLCVGGPGIYCLQKSRGLLVTGLGTSAPTSQILPSARMRRRTVLLINLLMWQLVASILLTVGIGKLHAAPCKVLYSLFLSVPHSILPVPIGINPAVFSKQ